MGSLQSWTEAASKAAETYKAPAPIGGGFSSNLSVGNLATTQQAETPRPFKAPGTDLFDTTSEMGYSGAQLNVERFYDHPAYSKLGFSPYRDNDAYFNRHTSWTGDFVRAMKHFGPGFRDGLMSNYNGLETLFTGKAATPSLLDISKGHKTEKAASIAMSTRGGAGQSLVNIPYNLNYTLGIAASIAAEDLLLTAMAPATAGGSLTAAAGRTVVGAGKVIRSLGNVMRGARAFDKVADAKKIYSMAKGTVTGAGRLLIPETATQFGKFYRTSAAAGRAGQIGDATLNMFKTAEGFGSMYRDLRMMSLAIDESGVEAVGVRNGMMDQYVTEFSNKYNRLPNQSEYNEMRENADKAMTADYYANLPVIYLTNKLTFGNASLAPRFLKNYAGTIKTGGGRILTKALDGKVTATAVERTLNPIKYIKRAVSNRELAKANLYQTAKYFKANLGEGVQELYQTGAATTFEDYYKNLYSNPSMTGFKYYKQSAKAGVNSLISQEGFEAFMGGLIGGGAVNSIGKATRLGKEQIMRVTSPNQYEQVKKNQKEQLKAVVDLINEEGADVLKFLSPDVANLVELVNDNGTAYDFADAGNFKGVEDIRATALYRKIQQLESAGATDSFIDALEQMKTMEDSEKMEALGVDSVEKADKLIDVIASRSKGVKQNIEYVNKNYQNPYNPNQFEIGTKERNEEILKQFAWEQAKKDLAFNFNQFQVTADRLGEIYQSAVEDPAVGDMSNKDFSILFNTTLADSKKKGTAFETSLENEIGYLNTEKSNAQGEIDNINEQLKTAEGENKTQLEKRKKNLQNQITKIDNRGKVLAKYAGAVERVKQSRATVKEGVERPSEEKSLQEMYEAFEEFMLLVGEENNTPVDKLKLQETYGKLLDFIDVAEDNRMATNAVTILSDPAAVQRLSDLHFDGIQKAFDLHSSLGKMLALGYVESKRLNEYIEALEEIGVVIPVTDMQALILEGTVPTKFISVNNVDTDANGFVIEGSKLWEQIQEISDQYEMGKAEAEADVEEVTKDPESEEKEPKKRIQDNQVPVKREVIKITFDDGTYEEFKVTTMLDGSFKASSISYDENGNETGRNTSISIGKGATAFDAVKQNAADESSGDVVTVESTQSGAEFINPKKLDRLTPEQKKSFEEKVLYQRLYGTAYQKNKDGSGLVEVEVKVAEYPEDQLDIITFETKIVTEKGNTRTTQEKRYETVKQFMTDLNLTEEDIKNFTVPISKELGESLLEEYGQDVLNLNRRENAGEKEGYGMPLSTFLKLQEDNQTGKISLLEIRKDLENNVDFIEIVGYYGKITLKVPRKSSSAQTKESKKPSMAEQAARSQQASKAEVGETRKAKGRGQRKAAKYQESQVRKELAGTLALERLDKEFAETNERNRKEGKRQVTFTQFINTLENIDSRIKIGREQADKINDRKISENTLARYVKDLARAKTVEDVDLLEEDITTMIGIILPEDRAKLDFDKRRNEIMAEEAKKLGLKNIPDTTPSITPPTGENLEQATETVESIDFNNIDTATESENGGEVTDDDINNLLC